MKKILISLFLLCAASGYLFAQDTITIYYDNNWVEISNKNDAVYYRKAFQESKNVWTAHDYYMSNKIQMTGAYKSKKFTSKQGHFTYFYENGNTLSEGNYVDDKLVGLWNYWYDNGQKKSVGEFSEGLEEGVWEYWYENGTKLSAGLYLKGEKIGVWNYYYEDGKLKGTETYQKVGYCMFEGFYANGNINAKGNIANGKPQGMWMYYNIDGRKTLQGNFNYGIRDGEWTRYFRNGEMKLLFKYGIPEDNQRGGIVRNE